MSAKAGTVKQNGETLAVAVRTENAADAPNAWAVIDPRNGGHWAGDKEVEEWPVVPGTPVAAPKPES